MSQHRLFEDQFTHGSLGTSTKMSEWDLRSPDRYSGCERSRVFLGEFGISDELIMGINRVWSYLFRV